MIYGPFIDYFWTISRSFMDYLYGSFQKWRYAHSWMVYKGTSTYKWMIWGYPHFGKPPDDFIYYLPFIDHSWTIYRFFYSSTNSWTIRGPGKHSYKVRKHRPRVQARILRGSTRGSTSAHVGYHPKRIENSTSSWLSITISCLISHAYPPKKEMWKITIVTNSFHCFLFWNGSESDWISVLNYS